MKPVQPRERRRRRQQPKPKPPVEEVESEEEAEEEEDEAINEPDIEPPHVFIQHHPAFNRYSSGPELLARNPSRGVATFPGHQRAAIDARRRSPAPLKLPNTPRTPSSRHSALPTVEEVPQLQEKPKPQAEAQADAQHAPKATARRNWCTWLLLLLLLIAAACVGVLALNGWTLPAGWAFPAFPAGFFQTSCAWQPDIDHALSREAESGMLVGRNTSVRLSHALPVQSAQPALTRQQLFELVLHAEKGVPKRPICIVTASLDKYGQAARHVVMGLTSKLLSSSRLLEVSSSGYADWESEELDRELTRRIDRHFGSCGKGVLLLRDFDQLPNPHRLLWRLCDDDHPLFPEAVIFLSASPQLLDAAGIHAAVPAPPDLSSERTYRGLAQKLRLALEAKWRHYYQERAFDPLWSRIANLVVFFQ